MKRSRKTSEWLAGCSKNLKGAMFAAPTVGNVSPLKSWLWGLWVSQQSPPLCE